MRHVLPPERQVITVLQLDYDNSPRDLLYDATFHGSVKAITELYEMGHYTKVGVVLCDDLQAAFRSTQGDWVEQGVDPEDDVGRRTTNVGDILVLGDQEVFAVSKRGFEPLPIVLRTDHLAH